MNDTILVVDDEAKIRESLSGVLTDEGFTVVEAADGRQALSLFQSTRPSVVILDVWMPEVDGIDVLARLRQMEPTTPVIVISGHGNIETAVHATRLGAFDFIEKPFSVDGILEAVGRAVNAGYAVGHVSRDLPPPRSIRRLRHPSESTRPRRSIGRSVVASGVGLHSGIRTGLILHPLRPGRGIVFGSLSGAGGVPALVDHVESTTYATTLYHQGVGARTVEHLLAALHAYRVTDVLVKMQGEVPSLDGSALEFCRLLDQAGVVEHGDPVEEVVVDRRYEVGDRTAGKWIAIEPGDTFSVEYTLDYPLPVGRQTASFTLTDPDVFRQEIAPARTFGFVHEIEQLQRIGLAHGGRLDNCILVGEEGVLNTALRFPDEFARHKILDICGDFYLLGYPIRGHVTACMSGHSDNVALLRVLQEEMLVQ